MTENVLAAAVKLVVCSLNTYDDVMTNGPNCKHLSECIIEMTATVVMDGIWKPQQVCT